MNATQLTLLVPRENTVIFYVLCVFLQFERKYLFSVTFRKQTLIFFKYKTACKFNFYISLKVTLPIITLPIITLPIIALSIITLPITSLYAAVGLG